jgi:transcriptional regulator with XRE-family HTH domain
MNQYPIGKVIRQKRKERGITAERLAKKIGVVRTYISKIEAGKILPSSKLVKKLETALKISLLGLYVKEKNPTLLESEPMLFLRISDGMQFDKKKELPKSEAIVAHLRKVLNYDNYEPFEYQQVVDFLKKYAPSKANDANLITRLVKESEQFKEEQKKFWAVFAKRICYFRDLICKDTPAGK